MPEWEKAHNNVANLLRKNTIYCSHPFRETVDVPALAHAVIIVMDIYQERMR